MRGFGGGAGWLCCEMQGKKRGKRGEVAHGVWRGGGEGDDTTTTNVLNYTRYGNGDDNGDNGRRFGVGVGDSRSSSSSSHM